MLQRLLPLALLFVGIVAVTSGVAIVFGAGWALIVGGAALVALAVSEASS